MVPIQKIQVGDEVMTAYGSYERVVANYYQGYQKVIKIATKDGCFCCTPTHRMAVWSAERNAIQWKYASNLRNHDLLITSRMPILGKRKFLPTYKQVHTIELNPVIAWFLGYYTQQNHITSQNFVFEAANYDIASKLKLGLIHFEPLLNVRLSKTNNNQFHVVPEGNNIEVLYSYLESILHQDTMPGFIWGAYLHHRKSFIAGVWDGAKKDVVCKPGLFSSKWLASFQNLMYSCGLESTLSKSGNEWQVAATTLYSKQKLKAIACLKNKNKFKISFWQKWIQNRKHHYKFFHTTPIIRVTEQQDEQKTWDITVENEHNFYANGYLTHNSSSGTKLTSCLTGDTRIMTTKGLQPIRNLVGHPFSIVLEGQEFSSTKKGFWHVGKKPIFKIHLENGVDVKATPDQRVMTLDNWKYVRELVSGRDSLFLSVGGNYQWQGKGSHDDGYIAGFLIGNKTYYYSHIPMVDVLVSQHIPPDDFGPIQKIQDIYHEKRNKHKSFIYQGEDLCYRRYTFTSFIFKDIAREYNLFGDDGNIYVYEGGSYDFTLGLLQGVFDASGIIYNNMEEKTSIRLWDEDVGVLSSIQRLLLSVGILSTILRDNDMECSNPNGHELVISGEEDVSTFGDKIGFLNNEKNLILLGCGKKEFTLKKYSYSRIISIESCHQEDVYDCSIERSHCFTANGILCHNCSGGSCLN